MSHSCDDSDRLADAGRLRRGWTTGACAAAATGAACELLFGGEPPSHVAISLPNGARVSFAIAVYDRLLDGAGSGVIGASAGVIKDAGDDPDVTHGALIKARVRRGSDGSGVTFQAGDGVGTVTRPGLPLPPGEPAINPVPRQMIRAAVVEAAARFAQATDVVVEISVPGGAALAKRTLNGRLGIVGGLSILGTTGIVVPYSCAAWIHTIHRGIDVARATALHHIAGSTGSTSERAVQARYGLTEAALIEMGDFVGGLLKYLRQNPVPRVTLAGGFAKMTKLGQGLLDLHAKRGQVDHAWLAELARAAGGSDQLCAQVAAGNTALEVLMITEAAGLPIADHVAAAAWRTAARALDTAAIALDVVIYDRQGALIGQSEIKPATDG